VGAAVERLAAHEGCGLARHAELEQHLAVERDLAHEVTAVVGQEHRAVGRHVDAVRPWILAFAPRAQKIAGAVEHHHRVLATVEDIDIVVAVDANPADLLRDQPLGNFAHLALKRQYCKQKKSICCRDDAMGSPSIFLSHNKQDKEFVHRLADDLRRAGVTAWVDEAEIRIGDSIMRKIEEGILGSEYLGIVLSPNSVSSRWVREELDTAMNLQITGQGKTVLPLLYQSCEIPLFLRGKRYADFTDPKNYEFVMRELLSTLDPSFEQPVFVSRSDLESLLGKLPTPPPRALFGRHQQNDVNYVTANAIDLSELEATVAWPKQKIYAALRELIADHKEEVFLLKGVIKNNDHPKIPAGSKFVLPMIFRGLLPPQLRSPPEEIKALLK